jgi:hypothetical protein
MRHPPLFTASGRAPLATEGPSHGLLAARRPRAAVARTLPRFVDRILAHARARRLRSRHRQPRFRSEGEWLEALRNHAADVLGATVAPWYQPSLHGEINVDSLARIQAFWVAEKLVSAPVDVRNVSNVTLLHEVQRSLGFSTP